MKEQAVKIVKNYKLPTSPGKYYRLVCLTGKNKGISYFIQRKRIVLGRSDKADIQVLDTKSSREHAELALIDNKYVLTDLGSQNGVVVNDLKVSQHTLEDNDKIIIGSTIFKYNIIKVEDLLPAEVDDEDEEASELEEYEDEEEEESEPDKPSKKNKKGEKKNNKIMIYAAIILLVALMLPSEESGGDKKPKKAPAKGDVIGTVDFGIGKAVDGDIDPENARKVAAFIHRGQREFREGNYFRALEQFRNALNFAPDHPNAGFYFKKTETRLNEHIEQMFEEAAKEVASLKYKKALVSYCAIVTYLQDYPDRQEYKDAETNIARVEELAGMKKGEHKCF
ncbi:MAG: FHA domain-containing protein [Oligoflexia bacterium]|nr:FHA domain-containing protein [Oligoflexia bacterium]